jgi:dicarboxylate transporter 10
MQTLDVIAGSKRPSTVAVIQASISQSGFKSLYAGLSASLMRQMSYSMVRLGAYEEMKSYLSKEGPPSNMNLLLAAIITGALGGIAGNPAGITMKSFYIAHLMTSGVGQDIILVRMTSDLIRPPEKRYGYRNAVVGVINLIRDEKFRGLTRGIGPNTVRGFSLLFKFLLILLLGARNVAECVILSILLSLNIT